MAMTREQLEQHGAPYPSQNAGVGGLPTIAVDVPADAVLLAVYAAFAATNMTIFQKNKRRGHKFIPNAVLFGFCMSRLLTLTLRIAWACYPRSVSTAIAANIFVNAGILIVYILNLLFASRVLRALQPTLGWHRALGIFYRVLYTLIPCSLVLVIVLSIMSSYTLDPQIHAEALWIQRGALTYMLIFTIVPAFLMSAAVLLPHHPEKESFGHGSERSKVTILSIGICLTITIAGFRAGTTWMPPRPVTDPAWYQSRAAFYCFNFVLEIVILALYTSARIDRRFHVHDGSSKRKTYKKPVEVEESAGERTDGEQDTEEEKEVEKKKSEDNGVDV